MFLTKQLRSLISRPYSVFSTEFCPNRTKVNNTLNHQQRRYLDLQEYQSKQILQRHGAKVQKFKVVSNEEDINKVLYPDQYGQLPHSKWSGFDEDISDVKEFVIKAQVLAGGRGKGHFLRSKLHGGVKLTKDKNEAHQLAKTMLNDYIVTKQTTADGVLVDKVMIADAVRLTKEFYLAILLDRSYDYGPILVASPYGGMDIEDVASKDESAIRRFTIPIDMGVDFDIAQKMAIAAFDLNPTESHIINQCANEILTLLDLFYRLDANQIEINPLGVTTEGKVISVDAKIKFDENARFRQRWLDELEEMNDSKTDLRDAMARKHNLNYIGLDGSIGCLVNGAGLAMATMDIIKLHGGNPANFLDVGGGASVEQVTEAFRIISSDPKVKTILVNIFGGIMRCDVIAEGIIKAAQTLELNMPIICRLQGTRVDDAKKLIKDSNIKIHANDDLDRAANLAVDLSRL